MARYVRPALAMFGAIATLVSLPATAAVARESRPKPNLQTVVARAPASVRTPGFVTVTSTLSNRGRGTARASTSFFYLSTDATLQRSDLLVNYRRMPSLRPGRALTTSTRLPARVRPGTWHVIVCADAQRRVAETNERDNCRASAPITLTAPEAPPRLVRNDEAVRQRLRAAGNLLYEHAAVEAGGSRAEYTRVWIMADTAFRANVVEWRADSGETCIQSWAGRWALAEGYVWTENGGGFQAVLTITLSDGTAFRDVLRFLNAEPDAMYARDMRFQRNNSIQQNC